MVIGALRKGRGITLASDIGKEAAQWIGNVKVKWDIYIRLYVTLSENTSFVERVWETDFIWTMNKAIW